ncbi:MAG TPA: EAL domain-containing protein [Geopsychrobacteraceae bacterium]|nr:EAL domain-containing protein [Geopsychrobacteraceae bacterium]
MAENKMGASEVQQKPKILIVDDDPAMLTSLRMLLKANGHNVEPAQGGAKALEQLAEDNYDLMLLDLQMPGVGGHEILRHIKENDIDTKVIVVSGETSFTAVKEALTEGAYDFVRKPYDAGELLTTINNGLQSRVLEQEHQTMGLALEESEKLHRYIVNNSPDIVYVLNSEGRFTFVNDRIEELLGYTREELLGQHFSMLIHEEDLVEASYVFNERRTGARASKDVELRLRINDEAKAVRYFDTHVLPIALHSVGMYNPQGLDGKGEFIGTYGCARDITDRKRNEELINYQAYHDLLTSLPNRALFEDRLNLATAHARRYKQMLAVMYLDVDRFKLVNDSMGHGMGDKLLQIIAERIMGCLRAEDTLARFGGDEFTLLLPQISKKEDAAAVARKILDSVRAPISVDNQEIFTSASVGIAMYPHSGETMETLVKSADIAMYHVKSNGKDGFQFFSDEMNDSYTCHLAVERDLHRALEQEQFEVFFQPKVNPTTCQIVGMEALIRWQHPDKGLVMPNDFIPMAEQTKLIVPIGDWVFRAACEEICRWREQGLPKIKVSINISAVQIEQEDFVKKIAMTLDEFNLSGDYIEVEITEYGLMKNRENAIQKLRKLSARGITIAIDDFGTGYSSLSYLQKFPVNTLKIDRSFVKDIETDTKETCIVDAIASMAKGLKLHMVAEGVETVSQLNYLKALGCIEVQGFLFGKPQSAQATLELMSQRQDGKLDSCLVF